MNEIMNFIDHGVDMNPDVCGDKNIQVVIALHVIVLELVRPRAWQLFIDLFIYVVYSALAIYYLHVGIFSYNVICAELLGVEHEFTWRYDITILVNK
jgi:hypothetical protein